MVSELKRINNKPNMKIDLSKMVLGFKKDNFHCSR